MYPLMRQSLVVSGAALNIAGHGCAHGYPAVLFAQLGYNSTGTGTGPYLTEHDISWIASIVSMMSFVANFLSPVLVTRYGKQKTHLISTIPALLGWLMFTFGESMAIFLIARLMHGLSFGLRVPLSPALVAEYTDPKYRGAFLGTFAVCLGLGMFLSHLWGTYLNYKMTALACGIFPLISFIIINFSPESPSWLVSKGRFNEASKSFRWLRGNGPVQEKELNILINTQKENLRKESKCTNSLECNNNSMSNWNKIKETTFSLRVFRKRQLLKPTVIAITMLIVFEFCGNHFMPAFGHMILMSVLDKKNANDVNWNLTILDTLRMICAVVAIFLLKCLGRRIILFCSGFLTILSMVSISAFIYIGKFYNLDIISNHGDTIPMCFMVIYVLSFCLGLVPINWVICGEIFPMAHRNVGTTISMAFLPIIFMVCMKTAPLLFVSIGIEGSFLCYALLLTICMLILYVLLPETKDKTLHEIENSFAGKGQETNTEAEMSLMDINNSVDKT